jgi:hypothetical protein
VRDGWAAVGPPHKQRYLRYGGQPAAGPPAAGAAAAAAAAGGAGPLLAHLRQSLFASAPFARLLTKLTTIGLVGHQAEVRRFRCVALRGPLPLLLRALRRALVQRRSLAPLTPHDNPPTLRSQTPQQPTIPNR